jgi:hypothetical protein
VPACTLSGGTGGTGLSPVVRLLLYGPRPRRSSGPGARPAPCLRAGGEQGGQGGGDAQERRGPAGASHGCPLLHRHAFGQIARLIHVAAKFERAEVREKLQGYDHGKGLHTAIALGHRYVVIGYGGDEFVSLFSYGYDRAAAGLDFLHIAYGLFPQLIVRHEKHAGRIGADEGDGAVLDLSRGVAFRVYIRNFLELKRAFQGYGIEQASAEEEEILSAAVLLGQGLYRVALQQRLLDQIGHGLELSRKRWPS